MKAQVLQMTTPDGPFTVIAQDGVVLSSGWTGNAGELTGQIHPSLRPGTLETGFTLTPDRQAASGSGDTGSAAAAATDNIPTAAIDNIAWQSCMTWFLARITGATAQERVRL